MRTLWPRVLCQVHFHHGSARHRQPCEMRTLAKPPRHPRDALRAVSATVPSRPHLDSSIVAGLFGTSISPRRPGATSGSQPETPAAGQAGFCLSTLQHHVRLSARDPSGVLSEHLQHVRLAARDPSGVLSEHLAAREVLSEHLAARKHHNVRLAARETPDPRSRTPS